MRNTTIPLHTDLITELRHLIDSARRKAAMAVNAELTLLYWRVGERIHREILQGQRAGYGDEVITALAKQLSTEY